MEDIAIRQANDLYTSFKRKEERKENQIDAYIDLDNFTITIPDPLFPKEPTYYKPTSTGAIFHRCDDRVRVVRGHVGSGKTTMECAEIIFRSVRMPPCKDGIRYSRCAVIRNTYGDLIKTTIHTWRQWYNRLGQVRSIQSPSFSITHTFKVEVIENGIIDIRNIVLELLPIALDTVMDVTKHLKSLEVTFVFLNELSELDQMALDFFTGGRMPRFPRLQDFTEEQRKSEKLYWSGLFADTNPPEEDSWIYKMFEVEKPPQYTMLVQPPAVIKQGEAYVINPEAENIKNIQNGAEEYVKMTYGKSEAFIRVYLMGEYGTLSNEKRVYYNYNDNIHSSDNVEINKNCTLLIGADLGTVAPAIIVSQIVEGRLIVLKEFCGSFTTIRELANNWVLPWLNSNCDGMRIEIVLFDPAKTMKGDQELREVFGSLVIQADTNNVEVRINAVSKLLNKLVSGKGGIEISRSGCPQLRKGFNGKYYYKRLRIIGEDRTTEEPHKNHPFSDCCAAGTKITMADSSLMNIEDIKPGMMVLAPNGARKVTHSWLVKKNSIVWEYEFSNGSKLTLTPDHKVYTNRGLIRISDLQYNDVLYSVIDNNSVGKTKLKNALYAIRNLLLINTKKIKLAEIKLVSKKPSQYRKDVYDLTVEIDHCFFANGIKISNCHDALQYISLYVNKELENPSDDAYNDYEIKRKRFYEADKITGY